VTDDGEDHGLVTITAFDPSTRDYEFSTKVRSHLVIALGRRRVKLRVWSSFKLPSWVTRVVARSLRAKSPGLLPWRPLDRHRRRT
jgi:hypothetical protein